MRAPRRIAPRGLQTVKSKPCVRDFDIARSIAVRSDEGERKRAVASERSSTEASPPVPAVLSEICHTTACD